MNDRLLVRLKAARKELWAFKKFMSLRGLNAASVERILATMDDVISDAEPVVSLDQYAEGR